MNKKYLHKKYIIPVVIGMLVFVGLISIKNNIGYNIASEKSDQEVVQSDTTNQSSFLPRLTNLFSQNPATVTKSSSETPISYQYNYFPTDCQYRIAYKNPNVKITGLAYSAWSKDISEVYKKIITNKPEVLIPTQVEYTNKCASAPTKPASLAYLTTKMVSSVYDSTTSKIKGGEECKYTIIAKDQYFNIVFAIDTYDQSYFNQLYQWLSTQSNVYFIETYRFCDKTTNQ